jgi:hypothetical protein
MASGQNAGGHDFAAAAPIIATTGAAWQGCNNCGDKAQKMSLAARTRRADDGRQRRFSGPLGRTGGS